MKIYGVDPEKSDEFIEMTKVSFICETNELRSLAEFLINCADNIDKNESWDHEHYIDWLGEESFPVDLVINSPKYLESKV